LRQTANHISFQKKGAAILTSMTRSARRFAALVLLAFAPLAPALADTEKEPATGAAFRCDNGSKLVLSFMDGNEGFSALIWLEGTNYRLLHRPPEPGPVQVVWSDGEHSLTWSPGVRLMWMSGSTHLMCGRGGHQH
jgi:hypothetical protein